jgi:hypothetical protein
VTEDRRPDRRAPWHRPRATVVLSAVTAREAEPADDALWPFARVTDDEPALPADASLLPEGATAWDQVTEPPLRFAPWPYDNAEIDRIRKTLPAPSAAVAIEEALFAARWFLARNRLRESRNEPAKPDPHTELARIRDVADELLAAIKAASPLATRHLLDHPSPGAGSPPVRPGDLSYVIERFKHDNRFAMRSLPKRDVMGRPERLSEQRLIHTLHLAWKGAHAMHRPAQGWPDFRSACVEPLALPRFRGLGAPGRSSRAWETVLTEAKRRFEGEEKSPI